MNYYFKLASNEQATFNFKVLKQRHDTLELDFENKPIRTFTREKINSSFDRSHAPLVIYLHPLNPFQWPERDIMIHERIFLSAHKNSQPAATLCGWPISHINSNYLLT